MCFAISSLFFFTGVVCYAVLSWTKVAQYVELGSKIYTAAMVFCAIGGVFAISSVVLCYLPSSELEHYNVESVETKDKLRGS